MRLLTMTAAVLAMSVLPAAAQSGSQHQGAQNQGTQLRSGSSAQSGTTGASGTSGASAQGDTMKWRAMSQDKVRKTLQDAGFQNVQVVDAAYLVHARTKDGDTVVMYINPPETLSGGSSSTTGASSGSSLGSSTGGSGSSSAGTGASGSK
ncbi:hypothetical protein A33M_1205 [Rhodovulum sp. PH10]|uniref:hypothetical protein n=1 Tax=Rhodovulum sp. PH10 TaxID=1187851 RepID=UPI00027C1F32|nr:hypothetical protein [Rhodovulum sp. PH10]EJW09545.1 hypothetical protein A33M_1205 [Rhodovulum sp. PH10]